MFRQARTEPGGSRRGAVRARGVAGAQHGHERRLRRGHRQGIYECTRGQHDLRGAHLQHQEVVLCLLCLCNNVVIIDECVFVVLFVIMIKIF